MSGVPSRLRELLGRGTPGPWALDGDMFSHGIRGAPPDGLIVATWDWRPLLPGGSDADAALIVAAVNALPVLLAVAEAASLAVGPSACDRGEDGVCQIECGQDYAECRRHALYEALARLEAVEQPEQTEEEA